MSLHYLPADKVVEIDKNVFFHCYREIKPYLNLDSLCFLLEQNGVLKRHNGCELIKSPFYLLQDKLISLIEALEKSGQSGFKAFYSSLKELALECRGHEDVIDIISKHCK